MMNSITEQFAGMDIDNIKNNLCDQFENFNMEDETNNVTRNKVRQHFSKALSTNNESREVAYEIAIAIETGMYFKYGGTGKNYKNCYRELIFNLRDKSNPELNEDIISNKIHPLNLVNMTYLDLASNKLKEERKKQNDWNSLELRSDLNNNQQMSDLFKCGKCKQKKTTYYQLQVRGGDEPMTTFITCCNPACRNRWRC